MYCYRTCSWSRTTRLTEIVTRSRYTSGSSVTADSSFSRRILLPTVSGYVGAILRPGEPWRPRRRRVLLQPAAECVIGENPA